MSGPSAGSSSFQPCAGAGGQSSMRCSHDGRRRDHASDARRQLCETAHWQSATLCYGGTSGGERYQIFGTTHGRNGTTRDSSSSGHRRSADRQPCGGSSLDSDERRLVPGHCRSSSARPDRLPVPDDYHRQTAVNPPTPPINEGTTSPTSLTPNATTAESSRLRTIRQLFELIAALDRRVPQVARVGEGAIARAAAALKAEALQRIDGLERDTPRAAAPQTRRTAPR